HEYFPNSNGQMSAELQRKLVNYYDFLTAYENLLRDSVTASLVSVISSSSTVFSKSEALGSVWYFARAKENRQIIHFINFTAAAHLQWRDDNGTQTTPPVLTNLPISIVTSKKVKSVWLSTPDSMQGTPVSIPFSQDAGTISCTLPSLHYWDMLVVEYEDPTPVKESKNETGKNEIKFPNIYPNPFNPSTTITYSLPFEANVNLAAYNSTGERIATIVNRMEEAGEKKIVWSPAVSSGIYFLCINVTPIDGMNKPFNQTNKLIYMK
ncbi:MAG: glycoside hydrolase family 66 protein, partial [Bacteroidota bacterium]